MGIGRPFQIYPKQASVNRKQKNKRVTIPSPTGGWNTRDDPTNMPVNDAVELINLIPRHGFCEMRGGYEAVSTLNSNTGVQTDTTNYLDGGDIAAFDFGATQDFSVELWVKTSDAAAANGVIIGKRDGSGAGWEVTLLNPTTGAIGFNISDGAVSIITPISSGVYNDGEYHHVAFTVDRTGNEALAYLDGDLSFTRDISSVTGALDAGTATLRAFARSDLGERLDDGAIDDLRIWDDVRTAAEIKENYQSELVGNEANLIGYWKMDGSVGASVTTITDDSANSNDLTNTGAGDMLYIDGSFGAESNVDLVTEYYNGNDRVLLSATANNIWDSTAAGAATSLGSGFTNGRWDVAMFNGIMGFVNGDDTPQQFDGTTLSALTITGSGLTSSDLVGIHIFKSRSYFWEADNQSFWYSATNALGGALTEFQLGRIAKKGGKLLRMTSWTVDGGAGPDDYAVFIMDTGEVIVYQGDDPGSALYWGIVGVYNIGLMVNDRAIAPFGGEIIAIGESDFVTLPQSLKNPIPQASKMSGAISDAVLAYGSNPGWEVFVYANANLVIINVPVSLSPDTFDQYVLNAQTMAGCRFTNIPARTWGGYNGGAYFGGLDGRVYRFNSIESDDSEDIDVSVVQAWTDFGLPENKQVTTIRPTFNADDSLNVDISIGYDFVDATVSSPSSSVTGGTPWGSPWGSVWGTTPQIVSEWRLVTGRGSAASVQMKYSRQGDSPKWLKTDALIKAGGNL